MEKQLCTECSTFRAEAMAVAPFKRWVAKPGCNNVMQEAALLWRGSAPNERGAWVSYFPPPALRDAVLREHAGRCAAAELWRAAAAGDHEHLVSVATRGVCVYWQESGRRRGQRHQLRRLRCVVAPAPGSGADDQDPAAAPGLIVASARPNIDARHYGHYICGGGGADGDGGAGGRGATLLAAALQCRLPAAQPGLTVARRLARSVRLVQVLLARLGAAVDVSTGVFNKDAGHGHGHGQEREPAPTHALHLACELDGALERLPDGAGAAMAVSVAALLLSRGASPRAVDGAGRSALHAACAAGAERAVRALLDAGAEAAATDGAGARPINLVPARLHGLRHLLGARMAAQREQAAAARRRSERRLVELLLAGPRSWDVAQVRQWLRIEGRPALARAFAAARVDGTRLAALADSATSELAAYRLVSPFSGAGAAAAGGGGVGAGAVGASACTAAGLVRDWSEEAVAERDALLADLAWLLHQLPVLLSFFGGGNTGAGAGAGAGVRTGACDVPAHMKTLPIVQVDYEPFLSPTGPFGLPILNQTAVNYSAYTTKQHVAVVLQSDFLRAIVLPAMGRVYSAVYVPTGHETLWRNDIAWPGGANNVLGWWLWIGGVEYTLPGEEHGVTWAMEWDWRVVANTTERVAVAASVTEPQTGLQETVEWSLARGSAALATHVTLHNPTSANASFAHWTNPQLAPGGTNELDDSTEFFIPTNSVTIPARWQGDLGPSPQVWGSSKLRTIAGWAGGMGDLNANGLDSGWYGAYSHAAQEGVGRVFDPSATPGLDTWTYGYHPTDVPMGSGTASKGYAEMWGGTVQLFPDERGVLPPGGNLSWREAIVPWQRTGGGLDFMSTDLAAHASFVNGSLHSSGSSGVALSLSICPVRVLDASAQVLVLAADSGTVRASRSLGAASPAAPFEGTLQLAGRGTAPVTVVVREAGAVLASFAIHS
eukprot:g4518.t1